MPDAKNRRFRQYSLRLLLLLITAVALGLGWWAHRVEKQRKAVAQLTKIGGAVQFEPWGPRWIQRTPLKEQFRQPVAARLPGEESPKVVDALRELQSIREVTLEFEDGMPLVDPTSGRSEFSVNTKMELFDRWASHLVSDALPHATIISEVPIVDLSLDDHTAGYKIVTNGCFTILRKVDPTEEE